MKKTLFAIVLALAACGGGTTTNNPPGVDAPNGTQIDAPNGTPIDAPVVTNTMITISGIASTISTSGKTPTAGILIVAKKVSDDSTIAMNTSGSDGSFSISAPTNGAAVDAYLVATKTGDLDTYLYPPAPLTMDYANIPIYVMTSSTQSLANQIGGADPQAATNGWIGAVIQDSTMTAVAGATLTANPTGQIHYNSSSGLPQAQATSTAADGTGYVMNVPAGQVTIGATKTGMTFHSHSINARAGKVTLTLVTP